MWRLRRPAAALPAAINTIQRASLAYRTSSSDSTDEQMSLSVIALLENLSLGHLHELLDGQDTAAWTALNRTQLVAQLKDLGVTALPERRTHARKSNLTHAQSVLATHHAARPFP